MRQAILHFKKVDPLLHNIAKNVELKPWEKPENPFVNLVESIISQQLSIKAADTIFFRFKKLFPNGRITPAKLLKINDDEIRECGISYSKISYIKGIAQSIVDKKINLYKLVELKDEEVILELTKLKGIGVWTAEMYLMFTLGRPDVFSSGDLGLQNAMIKIYELDKNPKKELLIKISTKWSPYRTHASRVLWKSLEL